MTTGINIEISLCFFSFNKYELDKIIKMHSSHVHAKLYSLARKTPKQWDNHYKKKVYHLCWELLKLDCYMELLLLTGAAFAIQKMNIVNGNVPTITTSSDTNKLNLLKIK